MEKDNPKRLEEFKESVKTGRMVQWWTSVEDLSNKVMNALNKQINRGKRPGWIRADGFNIDETQKELVEMSKKIRKLEEENNELKNQIVIRKPQLEMEINDDKFNIKIPYYKMIFNYIDSKYSPLTMEDVPFEVKHEITQEMLDEYNEKLPPKEVVEEYKRKMHFYRQANDCPFDIKLTVCNYGSAKANDVYVEVYFPDEIKVYRKNNIGDISMPEVPEKAENPIDKYCQHKLALGNIHSNLSAISSISKFLMSEKMPNPFDVTQIDAKNQHFYNDNNSLSIRIRDLMTRYTCNIQDKYRLVPTKIGTFEIKCSFICDEYKASLEQVIQVVVE